MITLKGNYLNGEVKISELAANIPQESEVLITFVDRNLSENSFWELITFLDWNAENSNSITKPLVERLSLLSIEVIQEFEEILAEKLFYLDTENHARNIGGYSYGDPLKSFSGDIFLYARALVVAEGKEFYFRILNSPELMPKNADFEPLLYVSKHSYFKKTGENWKYLPKYNYETFFNKDGWKNGPNGLDILFNDK